MQINVRFKQLGKWMLGLYVVGDSPEEDELQACVHEDFLWTKDGELRRKIDDALHDGKALDATLYLPDDQLDCYNEKEE